MRVAQIVDRVPAIGVADLLRPGVLVPSTLSVAEALERVWRSSARGVIVVDSSDRPTAIVEEARIGAVPPERRPWTPITAVARPLEPALTLPDDLRGAALLDRLRAAPASEYLVVRPDGSPVGVVSTKDVLHRLKGSA
jgi:CBS domain containing-hemolysin-like protein